MSQQKYKIRLKKGDTVIVRNGKYRGKTGKVVATHPSTNSVTVEGVNVVKKHQKPNKEYPQGGIIDQTKPINVSKVGIYEPTLKKASRISYTVKDQTKLRSYSASRKEIK
ncbi:MAG: 50S ribosomal protein L24 [Candidatus Saccharimonadales bacterium]